MSAPTPEVVLSSSLKLELNLRGYQLTPAEVWGRLCGEHTAFLDIGEDSTSAWIYSPAAEAFLGPRLKVSGSPEQAVATAMAQLDMLLASDAQSGGETLSLSNEWEAVQG